MKDLSLWFLATCPNLPTWFSIFSFWYIPYLGLTGPQAPSSWTQRTGQTSSPRKMFILRGPSEPCLPCRQVEPRQSTQLTSFPASSTFPLGSQVPSSNATPRRGRLLCKQPGTNPSMSPLSRWHVSFPCSLARIHNTHGHSCVSGRATTHPLFYPIWWTLRIQKGALQLMKMRLLGMSLGWHTLVREVLLSFLDPLMNDNSHYQEPSTQ